MKFRNLLSTLLAAALMCGLACTAAFADEPADTAPTGEQTEQQPDIEDWRAEQKIVVNGETYQYLLRAIMSEEEDKPVTVRLESNVQLTDFAVVLGTADYGMGEMTVASHDVTIDLNGYTLKAEAGKPVFEVQAGYTLTIVDSSEAQTGKLVSDVDAIVAAEGSTLVDLDKPADPAEPTNPGEGSVEVDPPADPEPTTPPADAIPAEGTAYASTQNITIDGKAVEFAAYALKNESGDLTNYVKLRDIAVAINGTDAQFEVGFDGSIILTTKTAYSGAADTTTPFSGDRAYKGGAQTVKVDGKDVAMTAITLTDDNGGAYNYFKLRDLGSVLGFTVGYSNETGISITTAAEQ